MAKLRFKQKNKSHKNGRHKTKGELSASHGGRVLVKTRSRKVVRELSKKDKRNKQHQCRSNKYREVLELKQSVGILGAPPHLVAIIPLSADVDLSALHSHLCAACGIVDIQKGIPTTTTLVDTVQKCRYTLVYPATSDVYTVLDITKVVDKLLFVYRPGDVLSSDYDILVESCLAQGLPTTLHITQGLDSLPGRSGLLAKKAVQKLITSRFPSEKLLPLDNVQQAKVVLRAVHSRKRQPVKCRDMHAHLLVDSFSFSSHKEGHIEEVGGGGAGNHEGGNGDEIGTLLVSGYVRCQPLTVNSLLHIPQLGTFQMTRIDSGPDPHPLTRNREVAMDTNSTVQVLEEVDPSKQENLASEVIVDVMEGEQTWPTQQELEEADAANRRKVIKRVPRGMSDYQAAWIEEEEEEGDGGDSDGSEDQEMEDGGESFEEAWSSDEDKEPVLDDDETQQATEDYDAEFDEVEEEKQIQLLREEREQQQFPDEMNTPVGLPAHVRFQKYRGLKSFRSSPWNRRENLPSDYARIFQFGNFKLTKKRVLSRQESGAMPGWYVTLHVGNVPRHCCRGVVGPMVAYSLLPHEQKMSVLHFLIRRTNNYTLPIRSKDTLVFHCGVRRFSAGPIFSQHSAGDKHKFERFLGNGCSYIASVFAPIQYPPLPVLLFLHQHLQGGGERSVLVATGCLHSVNPDRVVCKRIVLSGHPYKINKKSAVIRYMFFHRDDIKWFKPVELRTKHGRRGHIKETLGTHGHMKCLFDGQLKAQDTVLMALYKRVYPKWTYDPHVISPNEWVWHNRHTHEEMDT